MNKRDRGWLWSAERVLLGHFVACSFLGILILELLKRFTGEDDLRSFPAAWLLALAAANGIAVGGIVHLIHRGKLRRLDDSVFPGDDRSFRRVATGAAFVCGSSVLTIIDSRLGMLIYAVLALLAISFHLKLFLIRVTRLLRPGCYAHPDDIVFLSAVFTTLLIAFTLVNISIDHFHQGFVGESVDGSKSAFTSIQGSVVDYLYFSIVVMTTLGLGDICPVSAIARAAVAAECLTSYVMFALMIGVITRGIVLRSPDPAAEPEPEDEV